MVAPTMLTLLSLLCLPFESGTIALIGDSCNILPADVKNDARCRAHCTTSSEAASGSCLMSCLKNIMTSASNDTAANGDEAAPWPSVDISFHPLTLTVHWNITGSTWNYFVVSLRSYNCPSAEATYFTTNSNLEPKSSLISSCVYSLCLTGVDSNGTSNASGPVHVETQVAATRVILKPRLINPGYHIGIHIEWACPDSTCVFAWTEEYDVTIKLSSTQLDNCFAQVAYFRGRVFSSMHTSIELTEETQMRFECRYDIQVIAINGYRVVPVLSITYTIPSFKCLDGDDFDCPPAETTDNVTVIIPTRHPDTGNLGPVSNLTAVFTGKETLGSLETIIYWGAPNSPYNYVIKSFSVASQRVIEQPGGYIPSGSDYSIKHIDLSSNEDTNVTFNCTVYLRPNKIYRISVYCVTRHGSRCFEAQKIVRTPGLPTVSTSTVATTLQADSELNIAPAVAVPLVSVSVALLLILSYCYWRRHKKRLPVALAPGLISLGQETAPTEQSSATEALWMPKDVWELDRQRIVLEGDVGEGAFGSVCLAVLAPGTVAGGTRTERTFKRVAVKMTKGTVPENDKMLFQREIDIMKSIGSHRHVVEMLGCCSQDSPIFLVLEYVPNGSLLDLLRRSREAVTETGPVDDEGPILSLHGGYLERSQMFNLGRQVAAGMDHVSSLRILHRDLAARNVLVGRNMTLKVADFGLSRDVYLDSAYQNTSRGRLPVKWMALESLMYRTFTSQSDVWSYGIMLWEIATLGAFPYPAISAQDLPKMLSRGYRMDCPTNCPEDVYDIMRSCWLKNPDDRPSFKELHQSIEKFMQMEPGTFYVALDDQAEWLPTDDCTPDMKLDLETETDASGCTAKRSEQLLHV